MAKRTESPKAMFNWGYRESLKEHANEDMDYLDYWDDRLGDNPLYTTAWLNGWSYAATGDPEMSWEATAAEYGWS